MMNQKVTIKSRDEKQNLREQPPDAELPELGSDTLKARIETRRKFERGRKRNQKREGTSRFEKEDKHK
jgi:hypothetical protein